LLPYDTSGWGALEDLADPSMIPVSSYFTRSQAAARTYAGEGGRVVKAYVHPEHHHETTGAFTDDPFITVHDVRHVAVITEPKHYD
jgi:hypothetical protein